MQNCRYPPSLSCRGYRVQWLLVGLVHRGPYFFSKSSSSPHLPYWTVKVTWLLVGPSDTIIEWNSLLKEKMASRSNETYLLQFWPEYQLNLTCYCEQWGLYPLSRAVIKWRVLSRPRIYEHLVEKSGNHLPANPPICLYKFVYIMLDSESCCLAWSWKVRWIVSLQFLLLPAFSVSSKFYHEVYLLLFSKALQINP